MIGGLPVTAEEGSLVSRIRSGHCNLLYPLFWLPCTNTHLSAQSAQQGSLRIRVKLLFTRVAAAAASCFAMASVQTVPGLGGLPKVVLRHRTGSSAEVDLFGATLTSFRTVKPEEREVLFVSKQALFDGRKPIRGGVPLVFPQFGQPDKGLPSHGMARTSTWELADSAADEETVKASFTLSSGEETLKLWPYNFLLTFTVVLASDRLTTSLRISNTGSKPFDFQSLLHTYFAVAAIDQVRVRGLYSVRFHDKLQDASVGLLTEDRSDVTIEQEVDRIYQTGGPKEVVLSEGGTEKLHLQFSATKVTGATHHEQLPVDMVLWNPWIDKARGLSDFGDEEYKEMVCLEPGLVSAFHTLQPGQFAVLEQVITPV